MVAVKQILLLEIVILEQELNFRWLWINRNWFLSIGKSNLNDCESEGKVYDNYEIKVLTSDGNIRNEGTGEIIVKSDAIYTASIKDKKKFVLN